MLLSLPGCWQRTGSCTRAKRHSLGQISYPKGKQGPEASACAGGGQASHQGEEKTLHPAQPSMGPLAAHARWPGSAASNSQPAHSSSQPACRNSPQQTDSLHQTTRQPAVHRQTACSSQPAETASLQQPDSPQQQPARPRTEVLLHSCSPQQQLPCCSQLAFCSRSLSEVFSCTSDQDVNDVLPQKEGGEQVLNRAEAVPEVNTQAGRLETLFEAAVCHRVIKSSPLILEMRFNEFPAIRIYIPWVPMERPCTILPCPHPKGHQDV